MTKIMPTEDMGDILIERCSECNASEMRRIRVKGRPGPDKRPTYSWKNECFCNLTECSVWFPEAGVLTNCPLDDIIMVRAGEIVHVDPGPKEE